MPNNISSLPITAKIKIWNGLNTGILCNLSTFEAQVASDILDERRRKNDAHFVPKELNACKW